MRPQDLLRDDIDPRDIKRATPGVKVGFEFEICIPRRSVEGDRSSLQYSGDIGSWLRGKTLDDFFDQVTTNSNDAFNNKWFEPLDAIFTMRRKRSVARYGTTSISTAYKAWVGEQTAGYKGDLQRRTDRVLGIVRSTIAALREQGQRLDSSGDYESNIRLFNREVADLGGVSIPNLMRLRNPPPLTPEQLGAIWTAGNRRWLNTSTPQDDLWSRIKYADNIEHEYTNSRLHENRPQPQRTHFLNWVRDTWGTTDLWDLVKDHWRVREPNDDTTRHWKQLWWYVTPGAEWPGARRGGVYDRQVANWLQGKLSDLYGTVEVFDRYHERPKQLDRWYIEPDGSLRPDGDDYAAEVVGPPQPVREAITSLRSFVEFAQAHDIYTNSSTGLHINVSIPGSLDVLKLALFSGDENALKRFGREGSSYAKSIINALRGSGDVGRLVPSEMTPRERSAVQGIAKNIAQDHFSSVNYTGNYVSFRQAGGDYLAQLSDVLIVLRNFVRAMVIAADPHLAKTEYLQKLNRLVSSTAPQPEPPQRFRRDQITSDGIPALRIEFAPLKHTVTAQQLAHLLRRGSLAAAAFTNPHIWMDTVDGGVGRFIGDGSDLRAETIEQLRNTGDRTYTALVVASNNRDLYTVANRAYDGSPVGVYKPNDMQLRDNRLAVARIEPVRIQRGDARYAAVMRTLLSGGIVGPRGPLPETVDGQPRQHSAILNGIVRP